MDLLKVLFVCVFIITRCTFCENIESNDVHPTVKDREKHIQKREHQGLLPHNILKLMRPITVPPRTRTIPETKTQIQQPRVTLHQNPFTNLQRPINLRLNSATSPPKRVTNVTKQPIISNTTNPRIVSQPEVLKSVNTKEPLSKNEAISTQVSNPTVHVLIPKDIPKIHENHKTAEFYIDENDDDDETPYHPEYSSKLEPKSKNHPNITNYKNPNDMNEANIKSTNDKDSKHDSGTNKVNEQTKVKLNNVDRDKIDIKGKEILPRGEMPYQDMEKKIESKHPVSKTPNITNNKLLQSMKKNITNDNISIKPRKSEHKNNDSKTDIKETHRSSGNTNNVSDKIGNVLINQTYEEVYERSINTKPPVFYGNGADNIQTPENSFLEQNLETDNTPLTLYPQDYNSNAPFYNIKCVYNKYSNCYENDPNVFYNQDKNSTEYLNRDQFNNDLTTPRRPMDIADYPTRPEYFDRVWRTWRNSEIRINNNNEKINCKPKTVCMKEPTNVQRITKGNVIAVNGCYRNQNMPVTCRYCPSYQCYY